MKKYLLIAFFLGAAIGFLPESASAQYTDPYYNSRVIGDMINRKTMENAARRRAKAKKSVPVKKKRKSSAKKQRRISRLDTLIAPKLTPGLEKIKRVGIV